MPGTYGFPGFCSMDVVLFIWDQYMISMDVAGFHEDYLPAVMAVFLTLLKDAIVKCKSVRYRQLSMIHFNKSIKVCTRAFMIFGSYVAEQI